MKKTQKSKVIERLREFGEVSRNWCLDQYITRLAAIVAVLKTEGYEFETYELDGDYFYKVASAPRRMVGVRHETRNGERVAVAIYA